MKYCYALLLAIVPFIASGQKQGQPLIDSLLTALSGAKEDTSEVKLFNQLAYIYSNIDPAQGIVNGQKALDLSNKLHWETGISLAMVDLSLNLEARSDHAAALAYYQKALARYEHADDKANIARVTAFIAMLYVNQSNYPAALAADFKALGIYEHLGNKKSSAALMEDIGLIYFDQKEYSKTTEYFANALRIDSDLGDKESIARNLGNEGSVLEAQGHYTEAIEKELKALAINRELGNTNFIQMNLANIGDSYSQLKDYKNALLYQQQALEVSRKIGNKNTVAINLGNIGETYLRMAKDSAGQSRQVYLHNAETYLSNAVSICTETNYSAPLIEFCQCLSEAYSLSGNYKKAFESLRQYIATKDSVFSQQNKTQISNLEEAREEEARNKELQIKDGQIKINELTISRHQYQQKLYVACILLLLIMVGLVVRNLYASRKSNSALENEKKKMVLQIEKQVDHMKKQTTVLNEISHLQAHEVRGAVATILGLVQLFNLEDFTDPTNKIVVEGVASITGQLDAAVKNVIAKGDSIDPAGGNYRSPKLAPPPVEVSNEPE